MVSCQNNKTLTSPRSALKGAVLPAGRGVVKHSAANSKAKKVQRALETVFEETAGHSPSFFSMRGVLASPPRADGVRKLQRRPGALLPAFGRLRAQEGRDMPAQRKATPIKDAAAGLRVGWGRHRLGARCAVDDLAAELGATCQLRSALKQQEQLQQQQGLGLGPQQELLGPQGLQGQGQGLPQEQQQHALAGGGPGGVDATAAAAVEAAGAGGGSAGCTPAVRAWPRGPGSFGLRMAVAAAAAAAACNAVAAAPQGSLGPLAPAAAPSPMEPSPIAGLVSLSQPQSQPEPAVMGVPLPLQACRLAFEAGAGPGAAMQVMRAGGGAEAME
ncbi:hypothetical protein HXX76_014775 [Chlamydomonas incerta]|uniref:Uncharacterized protein n=1 Tax=Chlamydomonas incerta TaxID=51695 RepID=A0A835SPB0_CHLIN|nr:hypothetical protein HXX76_014775 [Chlamydomonas incerta]|eukprot:KAG2424100.1 hypothetical protein HXX76_014775 [Chlamydomonas incerta]